jgi:hypothetical protein
LATVVVVRATGCADGVEPAVCELAEPQPARAKAADTQSSCLVDIVRER